MPVRKRVLLVIFAMLLILVSCDQDAFAHLENAQKFYELGLYDQAIIELKTSNRFLKDESYFQNSIYRDLMWGILALKEGNQAKAISSFAAALKKDPGETQIRFLVSALYVQQRDYVAALQLFKNLNDSDPTLGGPEYVRGLREYHTGNTTQALAYFKKALAVLNQEYIAFSDEPSGRFVIDQLRLALNSLCGEICLEQKDYSQAVQYFTRAQKYDRQGIILDARLKIATLLYQTLREPDNANLYAAVGYYYSLLNLDAAAATYYQKSLAISPRSAPALLGLAIAYRHLRAYEKARMVLVQALDCSREPKMISAIYDEWGNYYLQIAKLSEATRVLNKAIELDPDNLSALTDARYARALVAFMQAPKNISANLSLGLECLERKDYGQALVRLQYVETVAPQVVTGTIALAKAYYLSGDRQKAKKYYMQALQVHPDDITILFGYVDVLVSDEDLEQAIMLIQKIVKKDPDNVLIHNKLAAVYFAAGQNQNAIREWNFVLEHINNPEMSVVIKNIIEVIG